MIITRQDLLTLSSDDIDLLAKVYENPQEVIKTLKTEGKLDIFTFYEKLRKSYNDKHSKVYINIMKEVEDPKKVLTTLSAFVTQVLLFAETTRYKNIFLKHSYLTEVLNALKEYSENQNLIACIEVIRIIKQDIKQVEAF